ncbi:MAG: hypothetical protein PHG81_05595 [Aliarcobacter sp.]|nr:hypothetical protein [Aliarcobacter sp.]
MHFLKDTLRAGVEAATGGKVTVLYDDKGYPSYMNVIPKFKVEDIDASLGTGVHPAFIVGGVEKSEIFIGQYQAHVKNGMPVSMPGFKPTTSVDFDTAKAYCKNKGQGWHLMTNWEWAAMALYSVKQNKELIEDIGQYWEWNDGLKLIDGQIIMPNDNDYLLDENEWKSTNLYFDINEDKDIFISDSVKNNGWEFNRKWDELGIKKDVIFAGEKIEQLKKSLVLPYFNLKGKGALWIDNNKERLPLRGGGWLDGSTAGLFALTLNDPRSSVYAAVGFRPAYIG